ncbi:MAG: chloride channel protein [Bacteroidota bacterium]
MMNNLKRFNYIEKLIAWLLDKTNEKQFLIFASVMVGLSSGLAAIVLKAFINFIRVYLVEGFFFEFDFKYTYLLLPLIGIGITIIITVYFFKGNLNRGASNILFAIAKKSSFLPFYQMYSHVITTALTVGFGGSSGIESPIVSTGAAIGSNFARTYQLSYKDRTMLLAAGAAGGIAGAFNAPIAGVLFALEVILVDISLSAFIPLLIAAASGALLSKIILNEDGLLYFSLKQPFNYKNVPFYVLLGLLCGFISLYYVSFFEKIENRFKAVKSNIAKWLIGGIALALLLAFFPSLYGEGYSSIKSLSENNIGDLFKNSLLFQHVTQPWILFLLVVAVMLLKVLATGITLGSGGNGGNFAPSLFVGAYLGFAFAQLLSLIGIQLPGSNFTIVAMAGILSGVFHAPLTGIFLIAEITGGYELIIPLMLVSSISYVIVTYFSPDSLDIKKLKARGAVISEDKDKSTLRKINVRAMIETDFASIHFNANLRRMIEIVKQSKRNTFPVLNNHKKLLGIIQLDHIKEEMFNPDLYDKMVAKEIMRKPGVVIDVKEDIFMIMQKFDESGQWNLPVVDGDTYIGFLSKSSILDKYRHHLLQGV